MCRCRRQARRLARLMFLDGAGARHVVIVVFCGAVNESVGPALLSALPAEV